MNQVKFSFYGQVRNRDSYQFTGLDFFIGNFPADQGNTQAAFNGQFYGPLLESSKDEVTAISFFSTNAWKT